MPIIVGEEKKVEERGEGGTEREGQKKKKGSEGRLTSNRKVMKKGQNFLLYLHAYTFTKASNKDFYIFLFCYHFSICGWKY
jgi:hypothetical protein